VGAELPTGTVTFLFTNIEGSTQLLNGAVVSARDGSLNRSTRGRMNEPESTPTMIVVSAISRNTLPMRNRVPPNPGPLGASGDVSGPERS
jgi:hypothetical protein